MTRRTGQRKSRRISAIIVTTTTAMMMTGNVVEEEQGVSKARIEGGLKDTHAHGRFVEIGVTLSLLMKDMHYKRSFSN
jgi:hypothetical protein